MEKETGRPRKKWGDYIRLVAGIGWMSIGKNREKWNMLGEACTRIPNQEDGKVKVIILNNTLFNFLYFFVL